MAPLIVITGPTASGKSDVAIRLAKRWGGEIICADSRTVYKGLDIGTAKPSLEERSAVPHHLLDVVSPGERFSAYDFQQQALLAIKDIRSRGRIPMLVGGSGLYIDSVVLGLSLAPAAEPNHRQYLEGLTTNELQTMIKNQHIAMPENSSNRRYLIRAIERAGAFVSGRKEPSSNTIVVAIATDRNNLRERIIKRVRAMFHDGVIEEAREAARLYGWQAEALTGNIYKVAHEYLDQLISFDEAVYRCSTKDWQLAKRQITWLKRHDYVTWLDIEKAEQYFDHILRKYRDAHPL